MDEKSRQELLEYAGVTQTIEEKLRELYRILDVKGATDKARFQDFVQKTHKILVADTDQ